MGCRKSTMIYQTGDTAATETETMRAERETRYGSRRLAKQGEFPPFFMRWSSAAGLDARQGMRTPFGKFCRGLSEPCTGIGSVCRCVQLMYSHGTLTSSGFGLVDAVNNRECIAFLLLVTG